MNKSNAPACYWFLYAGQIVFKHPSNDVPTAIYANAVVRSTTVNIGTHELNKAQQALQLNFHKKVATPEVEILDVVFVSITPLGFMTDEEFQKIPENLRVVPKQNKPDPFASNASTTTSDVAANTPVRTKEENHDL